MGRAGEREQQGRACGKGESTAKEANGLAPRKGTKRRPAGDRLAGSYVNFYIANGGIVMPLLDARTDRAAAAQLICYSGHIAVFIQPHGMRRAYWAMTQLPPFIQLVALLLGAAAHARRARRWGEYRSWRVA